MAFRSFGSVDLSPSECYDMLVNVVTPRPIALVSTVSADGMQNLAPFSYFQLGGTSPPSLMISPTLSPEGTEKDTLVNVSATREFVVNIVTREMVEEMNITSVRVGPTEDEWKLACFTPIASDIVRPPRVAESPVHLECTVFKIIRHGDGPSASNYVIGEVVRFHVDDAMLEGQMMLAEKLHTVGRLGGDNYIDTGVPERFRLARPSTPLSRQ
ncbi:MAG: flavin reductase family protein [Armatimonadetes bacterium]|nr:flavin reductase family protein [Armatimonadota bacterium]